MTNTKIQGKKKIETAVTGTLHNTSMTSFVSFSKYLYVIMQVCKKKQSLHIINTVYIGY